MEDVRKAHKKQKVGAKAKKKNVQVERHNPKAFTFSGGRVSVRKRVQHSAEVTEKRGRASLLPDKNPLLNAPPIVIVVQGSKGCGKSTLIRSLIKHYTKQSIGAINGPVTCVVSKNRRLTFIECPNEISAMLDLSKVADLVITLIDSEKGLEMDTFEFINILQSHGFPRILGVLTKLDLFKDNKSLKKFKKNMKSRFWTEIYDGAKLFYLTGVKGKRYLKRETMNLARFISVQKYEALSWRVQHPYLVPLSFDIEPFDSERDQPAAAPAGETPDVVGEGSAMSNRLDVGTSTISLSGYLKGSRFTPSVHTFHIPGLGDFDSNDVCVDVRTDPCPLPVICKEKAQSKDSNKLLRRLKTNEKTLYAPMCDIGTLSLEGNQVYIKLSDRKAHYTRKKDFVKLSGSKIKSREAKEETEKESSDAFGKKSREVLEDESDDGWSTASSDDGESRAGHNKDDDDDDSEKSASSDEDDVSAVVRSVRELQDCEDALAKKIGLIKIDMSRAGAFNEEILLQKRFADDDAAEDLSDGEALDVNLLDFDQKNQDGRFRGPDDDSDDDKENDDDDKDESHDVAEQLKRIESRIKSESKHINLTEFVYGRGDDSDLVVSSRAASALIGSTEPRWTEEGWSEITFMDEGTSRDCSIVAADLLYQKLTLMMEELSRQKRFARYRKVVVKNDDHLNNDVATHHDDSTDDGESSGDDESDEEEDGGSSEEEEDLGAVLDEELAQVFDRATLEHLRSSFFMTGGWDSGMTIEDEKRMTLPDSLEEFEEERFKKHLQDLKEKTKNKKEAEALVAAFTASTSIGVGKFLRITIKNVRNDWIEKVKQSPSKHPVILGGILPTERTLTYVQAKVKRHRWSPKIMKSSEVLTFSIGWRRFQSLPFYAMEDRNNARIRYLKYTPEHMHCLGVFWAHSAPPGTGFLAIKHSQNDLADFRISLTGTVLENVANPKIMKKLKLIGQPSEVKQHTAFIKNMFTSDLEVQKSIGSAIQTQAGVRGVIKKPRGTDGEFRAAFEAKILTSDIIICKAWYRIPLEQFCNPVLDIEGWERLRTFVEIRKALALPNVSSKKSEYQKKEDSRELKLSKLKIPKHIASNLPYASIPKHMEKKSDQQREADKAKAPVMSAYDKLVAGVLNRAGALRNTKLELQAAKFHKKIEGKRKETDRVQRIKDRAAKEQKKREHQKHGLKEKRSRKRLRLEE